MSRPPAPRPSPPTPTRRPRRRLRRWGIRLTISLTLLVVGLQTGGITRLMLGGSSDPLAQRLTQLDRLRNLPPGWQLQMDSRQARLRWSRGDCRQLLAGPRLPTDGLAQQLGDGQGRSRWDPREIARSFRALAITGTRLWKLRRSHQSMVARRTLEGCEGAAQAQANRAFNRLQNSMLQGAGQRLRLGQ